jgi:predicted phosphodiesterase
MAVRTAKRQAAEDLCAKFPDAPNLTLARRLYKENPGQFTTIETARDMIRAIRGAKGKSMRGFATQPRKPGKAGQLPPMPPSVARPWVPFVPKGVKRVGIISDVHIPYHSPIAFQAAVDYLRQMDIDTLLINGDFADFYGISRHEKNPHERIGFQAEMSAVRSGLEFLRARFPKARIIYKAGNHEERWDKFIWAKAPEIWDLQALQMPQLLKLSELDIEWVEDQRIVMIGELPVLHGHELPRGISSPVNAARGAYMRTKHTALVGHSHVSSSHPEPDMFHNECFVWSTGCLCDLTPAYARINRWNHGMTFVEVGKGGSFGVENYRITKHGEVRRS